MDKWFVFWTISFAIAGAAFAFITLVVLVRGISELRAMFARLRRPSPPDNQ